MYLETYHSRCLIEFPAVNFLTSFNRSETTEHASIQRPSCSNLPYRHEPRRLVPTISWLQLLWRELQFLFLYKAA